jgi:DNA-binding transcriptional LysR family regulator
VRDLEQELGVVLLRRTKRSVSLTTEGAAFFREVCDILNRADRAVEMVMQARHGEYGRLKIGLCGPATAPFLPKLIREFRKKQPGILLSLRDIDPAHQLQALLDGDIDIGFTRGIPASLRRTVASHVLFREPLLLLVPKGHELEKTGSISLKDVAGERFVFYSRNNSPELFDAILSLCKRARFSPAVVDTPTLWQSVLTLVEAGEGVSVVPATVQQVASQGVVFRALRDRGSTVELVLAWRADAPDPVRDSFLELLRNRQAEINRVLKLR